MYPGGPKFTYETRERSPICFARTHCTGTQSHSRASKGAYSSMDANNTVKFLLRYACKKDKSISRHVDTHT